VKCPTVKNPRTHLYTVNINIFTHFLLTYINSIIYQHWVPHYAEGHKKSGKKFPPSDEFYPSLEISITESRIQTFCQINNLGFLI